ncbi:hypothetical protein B0O99DRAFT_594906 [Bisporella sp. PMI_857]|nr:hypothetical protein B0O99DRAFT_594906 [Bisporella sp. PMI_857]
MPSNSSCAAGQNDESHAVRYGLREAITVTNDKISGVSRCTGTFGSFKQAKDIFSTIPTELKLQIMENLCSTDILNVRLTSKECAKLGAEYMFKDGFTVRPHLRDMARLEKVSNNSLMAGSVKCLTLFTGDMHITDLSSAVTAYIKWPGRRQFVSGRLLHDHRPRTRRPRSPTAIHKVLKNTFSMESLEAHCNRARLQEILPRFRNLSEIIITSTRFPFAGVGNGLKAVWGQIAGFHEDIVKPECFSHMLYRGAPFQQREIVTMRYWDILLAAQKSISRVGNAQTQKEFLDKFRRTTAQIRDSSPILDPLRHQLVLPPGPHQYDIYAVSENTPTCFL